MALTFDLTAWASAALTVWLVAIAWVDVRTLRIPDLLSLTLIGGGLVWQVTQAQPALISGLIGAAAGYAVLAVVGEVYFRRTGTEGLGLGDAKLFAGAGAWLGWQALPVVLLVAATGGLVFALARSTADRRIAFGPWLALALWLVWVWQRLMPL